MKRLHMILSLGVLFAAGTQVGLSGVDSPVGHIN